MLASLSGIGPDLFSTQHGCNPSVSRAPSLQTGADVVWRIAAVRAVSALVLVLVALAVDADPPAGSKVHPRLRQLLSDPDDAGLLSTDAAGRVQVFLEVDEMTDRLRVLLERRGCRVERHRRGLVQAWLPLGALESVAALADVRRIRPVDPVSSNSAAAPTAGASRENALHVAALRERFGVSGRGLRVGVISVGARGLAQSQAEGHLPARVTTRSFRADGNLAPAGPGGAEGTAVLELVHRVAPDAELSFANVGTALDLVDAIEALSTNDVLVSDIVVHSAFPDGRSTVATAVSEIFPRPGTRLRAFVQPAGNLALAHYTARYRRSGAGDDAGRFHLFRVDAGTAGPDAPQPWNRLTVPPTAALTIYLTWDGSDPDAEYRVLLVDCRSGVPLDRSPAARSGSREPPDFAWYRNPSMSSAAEVCYAIRRSAPRGGSAMLNVTLLDPDGGARQRFNSAGRSILPPADARGPLLVVGAVPLTAPGQIEPFSSRGPTFDGRHRPHLVAIDRLPVSGSGGFASIFVGTSAAAAYLGGVAALLLELGPALGAAELQALLTSTAAPLGEIDTYGAGRADPLAAARAVAARGRQVFITSVAHPLPP